MKKLEGIILKDFETHKNTKIRFAPLITTFVGQSGNGKSSILRGINLVVNNEPKSDRYISVKANKAEVGLILEDRYEVYREKSKSINRYVIYDSQGNQQRFDGFGTTIPKEVTDVLRKKMIKIDSGFYIDLNYSKQISPLFLVAENGANKAKIIDGLAKINVFNVALRNTNSKLAALNLEEKGIEKQISSIDEKINQFDKLEEQEVQLSKVEALILRIKQETKKLERLKELKERYYSIQKQMNEEKETIQKLSGLGRFEELLKDILQKWQYTKMLHSINETYKNVKAEIISEKHVLNKKEQILSLEKMEFSLRTMYHSKSKLMELHTQFRKNKVDKERCHEIISKLSQIHEAEKRLQKIDVLIVQKEDLDYLNSQFESTRVPIQKGKTYVQKMKNVYAAESLLDKLSQLVKIKESLSQLNKTLFDVRKSLSHERNLYQNQSDEVEKAKNQYSNLLLELKKCPICQSTLDEAHVIHLKQSL